MLWRIYREYIPLFPTKTLVSKRGMVKAMDGSKGSQNKCIIEPTHAQQHVRKKSKLLTGIALVIK